jgi:CDP-diacylglycerol--serine O-phosphatidyltransferase
MAERRLRKKRVPSRAPKLRIQNGLSIVPSLFTIGNIFCGYFALLATFNADYDSAAKALGYGVILDGLDGRIARWTRTSSDFGVQLDSLADFLTFGAAPALLAYRWGLGAMNGISAPVAQTVMQIGPPVMFAYVVSGALRLARFNVQSQKPSDAPVKRHFVGLPIPAGAGVVAAVIHFFKLPVGQVGSAFLWVMLMFCLAMLMISTVRYPNFKDLNVMKYGARFVLLLVSMTVALVFYFSEYALLILASVYVASGPVGKLVQVVRRLVASTPAHPEPAHDIKI